ncbi:hypothetical protein [Enterobacter hormaechei]|uniref:hypothetical protein n=1 Tax=Enterobacter hormaechei TaxID=158836 RepID=UPI00388F4D56
MTKYAKLDSEVLSAIGAQPTSFSELFSPSVRQECLVIAEAEGKHPMDVFRILTAASSHSGSLASSSTSKARGGFSHDIANH